MPFRAGDKLGAYEILSPTGAGGMGVVYQARDTRLNRIVAIKVLPDHISKRHDLQQRFEREARVLASLNHPNICVLHDIGSQDGTKFIVMEYVDGETLTTRIAKGALPVSQALALAIQIAEALERAHRAGVTHRDLKPANVMLTRDGVKVLDFGLAKPAPKTGSSIETLTASITAEGTVVGTPQYMAPEQLEGKDADSRADIWSFGVLLYEMLTGNKPFAGNTYLALATAIISAQPAPMPPDPSRPAWLEGIVDRCLTRDREERWQSIRDVLIALRLVLDRLGSPQGDRSPLPALGHKRISLTAALVIAGVAAALAAAVVWATAPRRPISEARHFALTLETGHVLNEAGVSFAISPSGAKIAYVEGSFEVSSLVVKSIHSGETLRLDNTWPALGPFFSPDERWVGFKSKGVLKKVPLDGGTVVSLCDTEEPDRYNGAVWTKNGILFSVGPSGSKGIARISSDGGHPLAITDVRSGEAGHVWPSLLPGGQAILFTILRSGQGAGPQLAVQSLTTRERKLILQNATAARYLPSGHLVYSVRNEIYAVPFDIRNLSVMGSPVRVIQGVAQDLGGVAQFAVAEDGTAVYNLLASNRWRNLVWVGRTGAVTLIPAPPRGYVFPVLSPDGSRIAVTVSEGELRDIWIYRFGGDLNRVTFGGTATNAVWTPDGSALTTALRTGDKWIMFRQGLRAGDTLTSLFTPPGRVSGLWPGSWTHDGSTLIFMQLTDGATAGDLMSFDLTSGQTRPYLQTDSLEWGGRVSPDGRWVAYVSDDSGRFEVYIRPYAGSGNRVQVSVEGGTEPVWARSGKELFYRNGQRLIAAEFQSSPVIEVRRRRELFEAPFAAGVPGGPNYDVSADDTQFLMLKDSLEGFDPRPLHVIVNWFEELQRLVPTGHR